MASSVVHERTRARIQAMQVLYQSDLDESAHALLEGNDYILEEGPLEEYASMLIEGVYNAREKIDDLLSQALVNWELDRVSLVEAAILRVATFELIAKQPDVADAIAINEAVKLAKRYAGEDAARFVNGALRGVFEKLNPLKEAPACADDVVADDVAATGEVAVGKAVDETACTDKRVSDESEG